MGEKVKNKPPVIELYFIKLQFLFSFFNNSFIERYINKKLPDNSNPEKKQLSKYELFNKITFRKAKHNKNGTIIKFGLSAPIPLRAFVEKRAIFLSQETGS